MLKFYIMNDRYKFSRRDFLNKTCQMAAGATMLTSSLLSSAHSAMYNPNVTELVQFIEGDLPILILVPHGGMELAWGIPARNNINKPVANFSFYSAVWTYEIAMTINRTLQRLSGGKRPYMVLNLAHRRYLDMNREDSEAYEVQLNAPRIYWEYHDMVRTYINRMNILFANPILIEITGHSDMPDLILRRTLNGVSVAKMVKRVGLKSVRALEDRINAIKDDKEKNVTIQRYNNFIRSNYGNRDAYILAEGNKSFTSTDSLIGQIQSRGYKIDPDIGVPDLEVPQTIAGDFTLERYGNHKIAGSMDAIQLVIGSTYRRTENYAQTGRDIGNAIWNFAEKYDILGDIH